MQLLRHVGLVQAKNAGQQAYIEAIHEHDIVFGVGPAGTGKTYLATKCAIEQLDKGKVSKIIITRPAVEAGEALGFLPGDLKEKLLPYLRPIYDALYDMLSFEEVEKLIRKDIIEIAPLAYMRGRTMSDSFILLDEAQNTTTTQMFMFLTRLGEGSKCVVTGDLTQTDLPKSKISGLEEAAKALSSTEGIHFHHFTEEEVVRHSLVSSIIKAYKAYRL